MDSPTIALPSYAQVIGIELDRWDREHPVLAIAYQHAVSGNPGMFHGGVVATLLEMAAIAALDAHLGRPSGKTKLLALNTTVEFLRTAMQLRTFACAKIIRAGRRLGVVQSVLWQESADKPVATGVVNILIPPAIG